MFHPILLHKHIPFNSFTNSPNEVLKDGVRHLVLRLMEETEINGPSAAVGAILHLTGF